MIDDVAGMKYTNNDVETTIGAIYYVFKAPKIFAVNGWEPTLASHCPAPNTSWIVEFIPY